MTGSRLLERLRAWSALLPLLALLAGTYWLNQQVLPLAPVPDYKARHDPDYIVNNFSATNLGETGAPRFLLAAQKMEHFPDDDTTYLVEPRLTSPYKDRPPVHISADRGEVSHNGDEVFLRDDVIVLREPTAKDGGMQIATSYLHVVPDDETADTDHAVAITEARGVTTAVGMKLDSKARVLKLMSRVRSQYESAK
ncbi:MAG TPA: LPS export ABC transporter periplasmic protein LptC [Gallionellaceae bacterium]